MGVLEKITANMELTELKKFKLQKAILAMMLEWKHLEEYMDSTQHSFKECLDELQLKEKYLNSVQESVVESNKEMELIRVLIDGKIKELDDKEREFQVFRDEQVNALDLKEKQLVLIRKSIEERIKLVELREKKIAAKQDFFEGIFKKLRVEEKQFEKPKPAVMDDGLQWKSESDLNELIANARTNIEKLGPKLPDKGNRLKLILKRYEDELERRRKSQLEKVYLMCFDDMTKVEEQFEEGMFKKFQFEEKQFENLKPAVMDDGLQWKSESDLNELIAKAKTNIEMLGPKLPDKGNRLKLTLKRYEDELERRRKIQLEKDTNECEEQTRLCNPSTTARAQKRNESKSAQSALLGESNVDALVRGEVEVPLKVSVPAGKGADKAAEVYESRSKRATSSSVLASQKRRRTLHLIDKEKGNEVQITRVVAVDEGGRKGEASGEDLPGGWSPKVDPEFDDKLVTAFNVCFPPCLQSLPLKSLACSMSKFAIEVWSIAQSKTKLDEKKYLSRLKDCKGKLVKAEAEVKLYQEVAMCMAEEANKLKAEQITWEAEPSKLQGEIDKANKLLAKLTKAKSDLERSLAARPNLRGRLDEKYLSQDCEGKFVKAEAEVKLCREVATCKAEEANKLKAKQINWERLFEEV